MSKSGVKTPFLLVAILLLIVIPLGGAGLAALPVEESLGTANDLCLRGEYQAAASLLERLVLRSAHEEVYIKLAEIYDSNLHDYARASAIYRRYLAVFSEGRCYSKFAGRLTYLETNKQDWAVIAEYKILLNTYYKRSPAENIRRMRALLDEHPGTSLVPDINYWLATEYQQSNQLGLAREYIQKYIATFPANGKSVTDKIEAYQAYAAILARCRQYRQAIAVLEGSLVDRRIDRTAHFKAIQTIGKEWRLWIGFELSLACLVLGLGLALALAIAIRPWKSGARERRWPLPAAILALATATIGPMKIVEYTGRGTYRAFSTLLVLESVVLVLVRLLAPLARIAGRKVYFALALLLAVAGVYVSFYLWDTLSVFYQWPDL